MQALTAQQQAYWDIHEMKEELSAIKRSQMLQADALERIAKCLENNK